MSLFLWNREERDNALPLPVMEAVLQSGHVSQCLRKKNEFRMAWYERALVRGSE